MRNRCKKVKPQKSRIKIYPSKREKKPIDKKAFMGKKQNKAKFSIKKWFIDRCKGATNSMVEDVIKWLIEFILLYILLKLL